MSIYCDVCGTRLPEDAHLCSVCGTLIQQNTSSARDRVVLISPSGRIVLGDEEVTIGRDPSNRLVLDDSQVSRRHAVLRRRGDGHEIADLGSSNGTVVNGQRLEANVSQLLHHGDTIRVGKTMLNYAGEMRQDVTMEYSPPASTALPPVFPLRDRSIGAAPPPRMRDFESTGAFATPPRLDHLNTSQLTPPTQMDMAPPPVLSAPLPIVLRSLSKVLVAIPAVLVLIAVILSFVVRNMPGGHTTAGSAVSGFWNVLLFVCQMLLLTGVICLIPTFVSWLVRRGGYAVLVIVESAAFVVTFVGFGFWLFGSVVLGTWILYAAALVLLIEAGSHFVEWRKDTTLKRLKDGKTYKSIEADAEAIKKMARYEVALYVPVPIGLLLGTIIGLLRHQTALQIVELCVQLTLFLAALVLLYFLVVGFLRMSDPLFRTNPVASPEIVKPGRKGRKAAKPPPLSQGARDQRYIDLACDVSGLRTIYKYDALHNTILLVAFILVMIKIWLVPISLPWLIISLLLGTLVFSEIPYAIGQYLLHNRILEQYTGGKYAEMAKKLQDSAPVFPPLPILAALLASGTAGGILYALLSQIAQNMLTTLIK